MIKPILSAAALLLSSQALMAGDHSQKLADILAAQPEDVQARYEYRHPQETLEFFGIKPGMTVVEALPGGGWYSKILLPYLGSEGGFIGADYPVDLYSNFSFFTEEMLEGKKTWITQFTTDATGWAGENGPSVSAFVLGDLPEEMKGTADAVLYIRAMHNLARFQDKGNFLTTAMQSTYDVLKPGGIVGIVQHQAPDSMADSSAGGAQGYLKKDFVKAQMKAAGFEYVGSSDINQNPKDQPADDDIVWRLPPTMFTSRDNPELRAKMEKIGESNRMTLMFRKPE